MKIKIGSIVFSSKKEAKKAIQNILYSYDVNSTCSTEDFEFLKQLIFLHPDKDIKIGNGIKEIGVRESPIFSKQKEFYIKRNDNSIVDFSYLICLTKPTIKQSLAKALRKAIFDQILDFKKRAFQNKDSLICPITKEVLTFKSCHVDHKSPKTFDFLMVKWIETTALPVSEISIIELFDDFQGCVLSDKTQEKSWQDFHKKNCQLQIVSKEANLSILKKITENQ